MVEAHAVVHNSLGELVRACVSFREQNKDQLNLEVTRERRAGLAGFARLFHDECGTLTPLVQERIEELKDGNCVVLMTAHQPNFFAYSGVFRKATLNFVLAKGLESVLKVPVVSFFGVADQDFTDDRWVRSCELPAVQRSGGILPIEMKLPEKLMLNQVGKPSRDHLLKWKGEIEEWLVQAVRSIERLCRELGLEAARSASFVELHENLASFWRIVEDCWERAKRYSDFNGFLMSKIVNDVWGYDTVFARFSECQQAFVGEFEFLLSHFRDYSRLLKEAMEIPHYEDKGSGVSDQEPFLAPFWYHCRCGSKAKLFVERRDGFLFGKGNCVRCQEHYELNFGRENDPDVGDLASQVSARAVPMGLVFFNGLRPCCYVGGAGGVAYLMEAEHVAKGLGIPFPPVAVWRPRDRYLGVGQAEAALELKRICKELGAQDLSTAKDLLESRISGIRGRLDELDVLRSKVVERLREHPNDGKLRQEVESVSVRRTEVMKSSSLSVMCRELKILENVSRVLDLVPSVIDYAVNVGLKDTSIQWVRYLNENGDFCSDVKLESTLDLDVDLEGM